MQIKKSSLGLALLTLAAGIGLGVWLLAGSPQAAPGEQGAAGRQAHAISDVARRKAGSPDQESAKAAQEREEAVSPDEDAPALTDDEIREANDSRLIRVFEDFTDKWLQPKATGVSLSDTDKFVQAFRKVPLARREECIHRALNLLPDENVMLLAGVLFDKEMDKETINTVYNDILNRGEEVKRPILLEIFKDKTHPCWADTAWILDVTGTMPSAK